jgi:hypothetical protein
MPSVLTVFGLRAVVYPNDHRPAHVHVIGGGCEAVFTLNCLHGPVELRENFGFGHKDLSKLQVELSANVHVLCQAWGAIHGNF